MSRLRSTLLCLLALCCLSTASRAQTLRIALREDADRLDPTLARTYVGRIVFAGLCDKLFDLDETLTIVPQLATGYEWADSKTLIIHLRAGVLFHDGTRMDADAVKFSLDRHRTMQGSFRRGELAPIERVEVVDPATLRLVLSQPSAPLLSLLTDRAGMIVSPKATQAAGQDFALHPICTGPFRFAERVPQDRIVLERFPEYWDRARIHLDRVIYQPIQDGSVRLANLQAGSIDLSEQIVPSDVDAVRRDPRLRLVISDALGYYGITNNLANGPRANTPYGRDPRVRRAFELSLDRAALINVVYNGMYTPTAQAVAPSSPFYVAGVQPPARDVAAARALLREAGVSLPVKLELTAPNSADVRQQAEVIQSMAAEAGFEVHVRAMEFAASLDAAERGEFEAYLLAWSGRPDADGNIWGFLHSGAPGNVTHYANADIDRLTDEARLVPDIAARRGIYAQVWAQARRDLPITYLFVPRNIVGMTARITGFRAIPDGMIRLQDMQMGKSP